jgi:hypothetical protein
VDDQIKLFTTIKDNDVNEMCSYLKRDLLLWQVGAVARYHCNEGYRLLMLFGQELYRCTAAGTGFILRRALVCLLWR